MKKFVVSTLPAGLYAEFEIGTSRTPSKNIHLPTWLPYSFGRTIADVKGKHKMELNVIWNKSICIPIKTKSVSKGSGSYCIHASSPLLTQYFRNKYALFLSWLRNESSRLLCICFQVTTRNKWKFYLTYVIRNSSNLKVFACRGLNIRTPILSTSCWFAFWLI
jgi:hypothetical protein